MSTRALRVLLVEDNPTDALLLREAVADVPNTKVLLTHVERLDDALARLGAERFDVVLLDLGLPDSRGPETFARAHAQAPEVPIIVLSGLDDEDVAIGTVHAGAQDYLTKGRVPGDLLVRAMRYAIERKRVQEELRRKNQQMEEELAMAREFQLAFLPHKYPSFPRGVSPERSRLRFCHCYRPSGSVGGDFFEILALADTQAGLFICDVMGHGVRAALVTAMIRSLVEQLKPFALDPGKFVTEINRALTDLLHQTDTTMFASAFYAVMDVGAGLLRYANAGHPSPIRLRRDSATAEMLTFPPGSSGPVLGLLEDSAYRTAEIALSPGEMVLLYTDGVFEVPNDTDEEYGQERLVEAVRARAQVPANQIFDELLDEIRQYSATKEFADDVCLVAAEFTPKTQ